MRKIGALGIILILLGSFVHAEESEAFSLGIRNSFRFDNQASDQKEGKTVYPEEPIPRRPGTALAEVVAINVFVWAMGQYVLDQEEGAHSYINLDTMRDNFRDWFYWDPNHFNTNFYAHPYHGNLYFNAARTNGLDFWSSSFATLLGSFMWEFVMEHHQPSINDWVMTSTGGVFLGEVLFRYSSLVWDDSATGFNRVWREVVGGLLNPVGVLNRLIRGDTARVRSSKNQLTAPTENILSFAGNISSGNSNMEDSTLGGGLTFLSQYGETFKGAGESRKPFDFFLFQLGLRNTDQLYFSIYAYGLLAGKELETGDKQNHMIGLFQHYDYITNETIRLGGTSFCPGIFSQFYWGKKSRLSFIGQAGWLMLGASNNEYIGTGEGSAALGRDYNYGTGFTIKADVGLELNRFGNYIARFAHYSIYTVEGIDGHDRLNLFQFRMTIPVWNAWGVGLVYSMYRRNSHYVEYPDIQQRLYSWNVFLSVRF
jgi:hypothetical protein